jgi:hypothetical protein
MRLKPKLKGALFTLLAVSFVLVGLWIYTGVRLGLWGYYEYARYNWLTANLPVVRELWHENIKAGDNVEELISRQHPHRICRFGRWARLDWFPGGLQKHSISLIGLAVIAKDGVLVEAVSYSDDLVCAKTFFNSLTPEGEKDYRAALEAYIAELKAKAKQERELSGTNENSGTH